MKAKKTISIATIKDIINVQLLNSADDKTSAREALSILIEKILTDTGNYRGFSHLRESDMTKSARGTSVGIRWNEGEHDAFRDTDRTRRHYI
jgi:hypothetical protein